jgi:hypothetical protein
MTRRDSNRPLRPAWALTLLLCLSATLACESPIATGMGLPGASAAASVRLIGPRGPYLDAMVDDGRRLRRFFFPQTEVCEAILRSGPEEPISYNTRGPLGQVVRGDEVCEPVGLLSLVEWRDRRGRDPRKGPNPRASASYRVIWSDEDLVLIRGRFPLVNQVGWAGGGDTIAVLPNTPECTELLSRTSATLEFRRSGSEPLVLLRDRDRCPLLGLARPVPDV